MRPARFFAAAAVGAALLGSAFSWARPPKTELNHDRLKADYIFMEGVAALNDSRYDDARLFFDRACALDPADRDKAAVRGELIFATTSGDSATYEAAYRAIRERYLADPSNITNGELLINLANRLYRADDVRMAYRLLSARYPARTDYTLARAWYLADSWRSGNHAALDTALAIYDTLEDGLGPDPSIIDQRIRALSLRADTTAIVRQLARLYATDPDDPEIALHTGSTFYAIGMPDSAIVYFNRACDLDSTYGEAFLTRAEYYHDLGDSVKYDSEVFRALESPNLDFAPKISLLTEYVRKLYTDSAHRAPISRLFTVMQDIHPGEAELHNLYGAYLAAVDSMGAAAEQFGFASDLNPDEVQNWKGLVQTSVAAGDTVAAISGARRAMERFPDNLYFPFLGASLLGATSGPRAALALIDSVDVSNFNNPLALSLYHTSRGDYLYQMNLNDSAFAEYDRAIELDPTNHSAQNNAAYYMACTDTDLPRARRYIEEAIREQPLNPTYLDTYAWVLFKQGEYNQAKSMIDLVLNMQPDSAIVEVADTIVNPDEEYLEVEEEIEPIDYEPSAEVFEHAGDIYYMTGDTDRALDFWRRALILAPDSATLPKKIKNKSL